MLLNASAPGLSGPVVINYCIPKLFSFGADWVKLHCIAPNLPSFLFCTVFQFKVTDLMPELCYSPPDSSIACYWENHWCLEGFIDNQDKDGRLCWLEGAKCDTIWSVVLEADSLVSHPKNCTWVLWNDIYVVWIARVQKQSGAEIRLIGYKQEAVFRRVDLLLKLFTFVLITEILDIHQT